MSGKLVLAMILTIVLIGLLGVAFKVQRVKASETIYIRADGSVEPDTAPISTDDNVTYTFTGNIFFESIVVERDNIVVDGAGYTLSGDCSSTSRGIILSDRSNVIIKSLKITNFWGGIYLTGSSNYITIAGNDVYTRITMNFSGSNNNISGNTLWDGDISSLMRVVGSNNIVSGNNIISANDIYITGNCGVSISGSNNIVSGNSISGADRLFIISLSGSNNTFSGNTIANNHLGGGISLSGSNNIVSGNYITGNWGGGVSLFGSNNTFSGNNITNNDYGIALSESSNNAISGNNIANNGDGISLGSSSNHNSIHGNNITANTQYGIRLTDSSDNFIYHNNFVDNTEQVHIYDETNTWDDAYPSGGNYWSDYEDKYPDAEELDGSGIWNTTYVIDENNRDRYPLMSMHPVVSPWEEVEPPVAEAGPDQSVFQGMIVTFDASGSTDDVGIRSYVWAFTDVTLKTLRGIKPKYTFNNVGDFEVTLNVTDYAGKRDTDTMWVHVSADNTPPVANAGPNQTVDEDNLVSFDGSASTDNIKITSYTWTFMDETPQTLTGVNPTYTFNAPGEYIITLNVTDAAGNWDTDTARITVLARATRISISLSSSTSYVGFKVEINGNLTCNEVGLSGAPIWLSYSVTGGESWYDITVVNTVADGSYSAVWMPSATGNYLVRATWSGNATYWETNTTVNLAVIVKEQNVFSVESNSTISGLAFNTTNWQLSFTATGPNGTKGYTKVTVAKSLVAHITNIRVYLNGNQSEYSITSTDDSWLLTFTYTHSTHQVVVDLDINIIPEFPSLIILPLFMIATLLTVMVYKRKHSMCARI